MSFTSTSTSGQSRYFKGESLLKLRATRAFSLSKFLRIPQQSRALFVRQKKGDKEFKTEQTRKHFYNDFRHFSKPPTPFFFSSDFELRHDLVGGPWDKINTGC